MSWEQRSDKLHVMIRRKFKKGFMEATTSNPDPRNIQLFTKERSKGKSIPGRRNSTGAVGGLKVPSGWGIPSVPAGLRHTVDECRGANAGREEEKMIWGQAEDSAEFGLYSMYCDKLLRGF